MDEIHCRDQFLKLSFVHCDIGEVKPSHFFRMVQEVREKLFPENVPLPCSRSKAFGSVLTRGEISISDLIFPGHDAVALDGSDPCGRVQDAETDSIRDPSVIPAVVKGESSVCPAEPFDHRWIAIEGLMIPGFLHDRGGDRSPSCFAVGGKAVGEIVKMCICKVFGFFYPVIFCDSERILP